MLPSKKTITLILTKDCNLRCGYCYLVHKSRGQRMPFEVAQRVVDYLLENQDLFAEDEAIWDFMGGEPLLEAERIERIIEYIRQRAYDLDHPWFARSWFSISSNGVLYQTPAVQRLVKRYQNQLELMITIDGPQHVHDRERVFADGSGSYQQVVANIPLWLAQFPHASTKVTIAHDTLPFVAESVGHLFELGIKHVNANVVFEDVWQPGDDLVLEEQLDKLGEAMIARGLWRDHECSLFGRHLGQPLDPVRDTTNWCGPGRMLAVDVDGTFYPCNRFIDFSLAKRTARAIGSLDEGLDLNRLRPFLALTRQAQSPDECLSCEVASGCAWCQGHNYDCAATSTIYQRATYICAMHKARVRANRRYWARVQQAIDQQGDDGGSRA